MQKDYNGTKDSLYQGVWNVPVFLGASYVDTTRVYGGDGGVAVFGVHVHTCMRLHGTQSRMWVPVQSRVHVLQLSNNIRHNHDFDHYLQEGMKPWVHSVTLL